MAILSKLLVQGCLSGIVALQSVAVGLGFAVSGPLMLVSDIPAYSPESYIYN